MKTLSIKQYAEACEISIQAAIQRVKEKAKDSKKYPEIKKVERLNGSFYLLKISDSKAITAKRVRT